MIFNGQNKKQGELKLEDIEQKKTRNMMKAYTRNIFPSYLMLIVITTVTNTGSALVIMW